MMLAVLQQLAEQAHLHTLQELTFMQQVVQLVITLTEAYEQEPKVQQLVEQVTVQAGMLAVGKQSIQV